MGMGRYVRESRKIKTGDLVPVVKFFPSHAMWNTDIGLGLVLKNRREESDLTQYEINIFKQGKRKIPNEDEVLVYWTKTREKCWEWIEVLEVVEINDI